MSDQADPPPRGRIAVVTTLLNESASVDALLGSLAEQTLRPTEVVIVDGGSTDDTWARVQRWHEHLPLNLLTRPGSGISEGRNLAFRATSAEWVAVTDGGVWLEPGWLESLVQASADADVVGGFFTSDPRSTWELALGATTLPDVGEVRPAAFLPSSRSLLVRRAAWERVGGYPEWLDYCEDLVFDLALKAAGYRFAFAGGAVAHFRPRPSLRAFATQYFRYARGDGKADLWRRRHAIRYATYAALFLLVRKLPGTPWAWLVLGCGAFVYTRRPYERLRPRLGGLPPATALQALLLVPVIRAVGDVAKMAGYPVGVWWRLTREHPRRGTP